MAAIIQTQFRLSESDAMDATMSAMLSVCERHSIKPFGRLGAALMTAARNKARDLYKRRRREPPADPDWWENLCVIEATDEIRLKSEVRVVQRALDSLKPMQQKALLLWTHGYTHEEIGARLDVSARQSCLLVSNALKKLRKLVSRRCKER